MMRHLFPVFGGQWTGNPPRLHLPHTHTCAGEIPSFNHKGTRTHFGRWESLHDSGGEAGQHRQ